MSKILVVDDVQTDRDLMGRVVASAGHIAIYATNGDDALELARTAKPALVLLDVVMPVQDGFSVCRKLKADTETGNIPVIIVSSKKQESDKFWGQRQGCDAYVVKPFTNAELTEAIRKFLP